MNNFSKLYLLSPENYNKLILDKMVRQGLDREMYNIIAMKKIADSEKWYLYRQQLVKFASKSRHNEFQNSSRKEKIPVFDRASQTNRVLRPIHDKGAQVNVEKNEMSVQTMPNMDETNYDYSPVTEDFNTINSSGVNEEEEEEGKIWSPTARSKPKPKAKQAKKKLNFDNASERRKSLNDSVISISEATASSTARKLLDESAKRPVLKRAITLPGSKQLQQSLLDFPVRKRAPVITRAASKAKGSQEGGRRIKWSCMK